MRLTGGCLCGAVRYALTVEGGDVADYCHCRQCQKASGAPVMAWVQVPPSRFEVVQGQARAFASSARSARWFCPTCGSSLYMTDAAGRSIGVALGSLDDPAAVAPTAHGWTSAQLPWLVLDDDLPRYDGDPPYDL
ncbi:MAG: GFA family protein [Caulobacteraceae bacterium]|nr:GFA family protein [Caulobacteraceae bacterium]